MTKRSDMTGRKAGRTTVVRMLEKRNPSGLVMYQCVCECGRTGVLSSSQIIRKRTYNRVAECECELHIRKKYNANIKTMRSVWEKMLDRATNPDSDNWNRYGGRGIGVCESWNSFEKFWSDMGSKVNNEMTIERIDNNKGYFPENVRWASHHDQSRNKRTNVNYDHDGKCMCRADWADSNGIKRTTLEGRLERGWDFERAISEKPTQKRKVENMGYLVELAKTNGIKVRTMKTRIFRLGWNHIDAATIPTGPNGVKKKS